MEPGVTSQRNTKYTNLQLSSMGVAEEGGISATGEFVPKLRVTHDLSFPGEV